jgi:hypothetical protein
MSNTPYKRIKYEKQNGFDIPYYDNNALPFPSICSTCERYEIINNSRTSPIGLRYRRCSDNTLIEYQMPADTYWYVCSCGVPVRFYGSTNYSITSIGVCP